MKCFLYIALVAFFCAVAVEGYGRKIYRKHHVAPSKSNQTDPPRSNHGSQVHSQESHEESRRPSHVHNFRPHRRGYWDYAPPWRRGPWNSGVDRDGYESNNYDNDSSDEFGSYEDYGDWFDYYYPRRPWKRPIKKPVSTTTALPSTIHDRHPWTVTTIPTHTENPVPKRESTEFPWEANPLSSLTHRPSRTPNPNPDTDVSNINEQKPSSEDTQIETTTFIPETTTTEEEFTTLSPEVQNCIDTCISTPEYHPVCGTNGETYDNEGKLFCAKSCGVDVSLRRRSICPPPIFDFDDGPPPAPPPTTTANPIFMARTTLFSSFQMCMRLCRITASFTPVCGTDLVTYMNMDRFKCAQSCGKDIEVLCVGPCAACGLAHPVTAKTTTLPSTTPSDFGRSTLELGVKNCMDTCPLTPEYNPVCGSDSITYKNPGHLLCAQLCGVAVSVARLSPCSPSTTTSSTTELPTRTSTTTEPPIISVPPEVLTCIRNCPVTSQYDPVCGTDDLTYTNLANLECSRYCGLDVELKHKSRCFDEFDLGTDEMESTPSQNTEAVNRINDVLTTTSRNAATTSSLFTSPTTTPSTTPPSTQSTMQTTTATSTQTTTQSLTSSTTLVSTLTTTAAQVISSTSSTSLDFTIPPDILKDIFGSPSSQPPSPTDTANSNEDENIDLDSRFSNDTEGNTNDSKIVFRE